MNTHSVYGPIYVLMERRLFGILIWRKIRRIP